MNVCENCGEKFKSNSYLIRHKNRTYPCNKNNNNYTCNVCGKNFKYKSKYEQHTNRVTNCQNTRDTELDEHISKTMFNKLLTELAELKQSNEQLIKSNNQIKEKMETMSLEQSNPINEK